MADEKFVICRKRKCGVRVNCPIKKNSYQQSKSILLEDCIKCKNYFHGVDIVKDEATGFVGLFVKCSHYKVTEEVVKVVINDKKND